MTNLDIMGKFDEIADADTKGNSKMQFIFTIVIPFCIAIGMHMFYLYDNQNKFKSLYLGVCFFLYPNKYLKGS